MFRKGIRVVDMSQSLRRSDNLKFTDLLFKRVSVLWDNEVNNDFIVQMAKGVLDIERFKNYLMQDYFYLLDYLDILKKLKNMCVHDSLFNHLDKMIKETMHETYSVHVPYMNRVGITQKEIFNCKIELVIKDYISYIKSVIEEHTILGGVIALFQCSWGYAYVSEKAWKLYGNDEHSVYKDWFDAYSTGSYIDANQDWIDLINEMTRFLDTDQAEILCDIFVKCAQFENQFWNVL